MSKEERSPQDSLGVQKLLWLWSARNTSMLLNVVASQMKVIKSKSEVFRYLWRRANNKFTICLETDSSTLIKLEVYCKGHKRDQFVSVLLQINYLVD